MSRDVEPGRGGAGWEEISPCEHFVQIYDEEEAFLETLEGFAAGGLKLGDSVVVIATAAHVGALRERLCGYAFDLEKATLTDQLIALEAGGVLEKCMVNGQLDEYLFEKVVTDLLKRAAKGGRRVRAFGEMVEVMRKVGQIKGMVRLEQLWHDLCRVHAFSLFCAYPRAGFGADAEAAVREICLAHAKHIVE